ncbi:uncharacterized protein LOC133324787 [Musca vetustissima]|uniref:uncharacterized protein LOC133322462 n=1 Tax=Musca vetustissima TaxID=27455 RepID=UPI002AB62021|nr:uncharacterized protein LOC133322462 [Musca vetustissima]XP_061389609.1 uncharacterized protein LOC133324787 [Musca vetustissima]
MKFPVCGVLFLVASLFVAMVLCDEARGFFKDSDHPGRCVHEGLFLLPGEQGKPKGQCMLFLCDNKNGFGRIQGCNYKAPMPNCSFGDYINIDAPYPECCNRHQICP